MPKITGYNPGGRFGRHAQGENVRGEPITNPDGIYSGMTLGLAIDGDGFVDVSDMPPDSRDHGTLQDQNQFYNDDADPR